MIYRVNPAFFSNSHILCQPYQNKDLLYQKYIIEAKGAPQISKEFKCSDVTILNWLKKFKIPIRTKSEVKIGKKNPMYGISRYKEKNSNWKGGKTIDKDGRVLVRKPDHPYVNKNGYVLRSRIVMEKQLGRYLKPEEIVHHKNKNVADDCPEKLRLFPSKSEHTSFHHKQRRNPNILCQLSSEFPLKSSGEARSGTIPA